MPLLRGARGSILLTAFAVVLVSCTGDEGAPATTATPTSTTINVTVRTTTERAITVGDGIDGGIADQFEQLLADLQTETEILRGLSFLSPPAIALMAPDDFEQRRSAFVDSLLDPVALSVETRLHRLLGLLTSAEDLNAILMRVASTPVTAYYDGEAGEVVVTADSAEPGPVQRSAIVAALTAAVTDQYHLHSMRLARLTANGRYDEAEALAALVQADAVTSQLRYLEGLPDTTRVEAAAVEEGFARSPEPAFLGAELAFPTDAGLTFVTALLDDGGLAALDAAYSTDALSTELITHPERYLAGERVTTIEPPDVTVAGYTVQDAGSLGELGLRGVLSAAAPPGLLSQITDGWGADAFVTLTDADDVAFVYLYRGDSSGDAFEVAQAFIDHATLVMGLAEPVAVGGGVEFVGLAPVDGETPEGGETTTVAPTTAEGPYVYVDRAGDGLVVVISGDVAAGRALRDQVSAP